MSAPLTPERLAEYAALEQAATKGPWHNWTEKYPHLVLQGETGTPPGEMDGLISVNLAVDEHADGAFIAVARTAVPELLAEVARLSALVTAMHAAAVGETRPPLLGLVEDVALTRDAFLAQQARADTLDGIAREMAARVAELEEDSATLAALEAAGVDGWEGYDDAVEAAEPRPKKPNGMDPRLILGVWADATEAGESA